MIADKASDLIGGQRPLPSAIVPDFIEGRRVS
jgi:hypothetical protein